MGQNVVGRNAAVVLLLCLCHAFGIGCLAMVVQPHLRFGHPALYPERNDGGQNSDEEHHSPVGVTQNDARYQRGQRIADCPGALHH